MIEYKKPRILVVKDEHPEKVGDKYAGGVSGCPEEFGFVGPEECAKPMTDGMSYEEKIEYKSSMCKKCWMYPAVRRQ